MTNKPKTVEDYARKLYKRGENGNFLLKEEDIAKFISQLKKLMPSEKAILEAILSISTMKGNSRSPKAIAKSTHKLFIEKMFGK